MADDDNTGSAPAPQGADEPTAYCASDRHSLCRGVVLPTERLCQCRCHGGGVSAVVHPLEAEVGGVVWQGVGRLVADIQDAGYEVPEGEALARSEQLTGDLIALLSTRQAGSGAPGEPGDDDLTTENRKLREALVDSAQDFGKERAKRFEIAGKLRDALAEVERLRAAAGSECEPCDGTGECGYCDGDGCGAPGVPAGRNPGGPDPPHCADGTCTACNGSGWRAAAPASEDDEAERLRAENESLRTSLSAAEDHLSALLNERDDLRKELGY